jgi:hypothetical protein
MNGLGAAERIMGQNFFGPDDLSSCSEVNISRDELEKI